MELLTKVSTIVGLAFISYYTFQLLLWVYRTFIYKSSSVRQYLGKERWAVVTGCTGGIGEGFAEELAARKTNLILVSRSKDKLEAQSAELKKKYGVQTRIVVIDFKNRDIDFGNLRRVCEDVKNVSVLINNVGINSYVPDALQDYEQKDIDDMIWVNINGTVNVTRAVLPTMIKGKGLIVNLSSYTSDFPTPLMSIYSGTKSFMDAMAVAMRGENKNIEVLSITPMYVASAMTHIKKPTLTACSGRRLARDTLNAVGSPLLPSSFSPYFMHRVMTFVIGVLPASLVRSKMFSQMKFVRSRILRRKERQEKEKQ